MVQRREIWIHTGGLQLLKSETPRGKEILKAHLYHVVKASSPPPVMRASPLLGFVSTRKSKEKRVGAQPCLAACLLHKLIWRHWPYLPRSDHPGSLHSGNDGDGTRRWALPTSLQQQSTACCSPGRWSSSTPTVGGPRAPGSVYLHRGAHGEPVPGTTWLLDWRTASHGPPTRHPHRVPYWLSQKAHLFNAEQDARVCHLNT